MYIFNRWIQHSLGHIHNIRVQVKMWHDVHFVEFNFKFSQCHLLDQTTTNSDLSTTHCIKDKKKKQVQEEQQLARPMNILEKNLHDMEIYEEKLLAFCGLWDEYPRHYYRMEFRIEMGQLVGYSNVDGGKALASYDGRIINMIIIHPKETNRPLDHYRGRLGWNKKYIVWEKEDSSRETGWRSTRRWIKIE